jgi:hypothetical protein
MLTGVSRGKEPDDRFFSNFKWSEIKYPQPFVSYKDTTMLATVLLADSSLLKPSFFATLQKSINSSYSNDNYDDYYQYYGDDTETHFYSSRTTGESVRLELNKFIKYTFYESLPEFWTAQRYQFLNQNSLVLSQEKKTENGPIKTLQFRLTDTGSNRAIFTKLILKGGAMYTLQTVADTTFGLSPWQKQFFESFSPADTLIKPGIFESKGKLYLEDLASKDSTVKKIAEGSVYNVEYDDHDATALSSFFKSGTYYSQKLDNRAELIYDYGTLKGSGIISGLKQLYTAAGDTAALQISILEALARQATPQAYSTLLALMKQETPLGQSDDAVQAVFNHLADTLKLAKMLYPELLTYTRYPEYKKNVYALLADIIDSGYATSSIYAGYKSQIINDALNDLKRKQTSDNASEDDYGYDSYTSNYDWNNRTDLYYYSVLLKPFYADAKAKTFFDKIQRLSDDEARMEIGVFMLKNNLPVGDTIFNTLSKNMNTRVSLYDALSDIKHTDKFDKKYATQESFARAALFAGNYNEKKDSIEFLTVKPLHNRLYSGYVWFYKYKKEDDNSWEMAYTIYSGKDTSQLNPKSMGGKTGINIIASEPADVEKKIADEMETLAYTGRQRYQVKGSNNNYYDYGD